MDPRRQLAIVALVYVIEGFPMGVFQHVFSVYFRRHGVSLAEIGFLSALGYAWMFKAFWSPLVERIGARQDWIRAALLAMAASLAAVALLPASPIGSALLAALVIYCIASATQDIAIDGYTIGLVDRGREGPANAVRTTAYRIGLALSGSGMLLLAGWLGWRTAFFTATAASVAFAVSLALTPKIPLPPPAQRQPLHSLWAWLARPGLVPVLAFVILFRIGDRAMGPMLPTFWVDRGFSDPEIALIQNLLGAGATIVGAIAGGAWVARAGIVPALWGTGAFALASNLVYASAAAWPESGRIGVYVASLIEAVSGGAVGAAFVSYLMRICEREHAAVQYAVLTGLYASVGTLLASYSGRITEATGYAGYFALTAAFAAPAFAFLSRAARWIEPVEAQPD